MTTATHALDRVLAFNYYHVLGYTNAAERLAIWSKLRMPDVMPSMGLGMMAESAIGLWWADTAQAAAAPNASETTGSNRLWITLALAGAALLVFFILRRRRA